MWETPREDAGREIRKARFNEPNLRIKAMKAFPAIVLAACIVAGSPAFAHGGGAAAAAWVIRWAAVTPLK